jgi:hypothetical protein
MKGELRNKKVLVRGEGVFIGVDVHKESWHVTARTEGEDVYSSIKSQSDIACQIKYRSGHQALLDQSFSWKCNIFLYIQ